MEFPRHLHKPDGLYVVPENQEQYDALKARGWADQCPAHVEQPKHVTLWDALNEPEATPAKAAKPAEASGVSSLSVNEAEDLIASADAEQLAAIKAEELAGKGRKGILALIDVREADLIGD